MTTLNNLFDESPAAPPTPAAPARPPDNPLLFAHRCLRGRYPYAIALGLLLAGPAAFLGYTATKPQYDSNGTVQVQAKLPRNLYQTDDNALPPLFDSMVGTQVAILQSRRVADEALKSEALKRAGWPSGPDGLALLQERLAVTSRRQSELITVTVTYEDPALAKEAVNAVLDAFDKFAGEQSGLRISSRQRHLELREREYQNKVATHRDKIYDLAGEFGTENLDVILGKHVDDLSKANDQLTRLNLAISQVQARTQGDQPPAPSPIATIEQLAADDAELANLFKRRASYETHIEMASRQFGPAHPEMKSLRQELEIVEGQIEQRAAIVRAAKGQGGIDTSTASLEQLMGMRVSLELVRNELDQKVKAMGRARANIMKEREALGQAKLYLDETSRQLEIERTEEPNTEAGRVRVMLKGELPVAPSTDRRIPLAAVGGLAGIGFGVGLIGLIGFASRRYRYIDDLERTTPDVPLLGSLPDLTGVDAEKDDLAALSVHHLRNLLLLQRGPSPARADILTITSAAAGDGKTSLAMALGMSYAVAGMKTVLLDADLVGRGLSRQLGLADLPGLTQAVGGASLNGELHATRFPNLWAIPAGTGDQVEPKHLSMPALRRLLDQLHEQFDIVLIDTGPLLGSIEANLVAALSDRVVVTVSRGQDPKAVQAALGRLRSLGAACAGLVFNRANVQDMQRSISHVSLGSASMRSLPAPRSRAEADNARGALVRAVTGASEPDDPAKP